MEHFFTLMNPYYRKLQRMVTIYSIDYAWKRDVLTEDFQEGRKDVKEEFECQEKDFMG